MNKYLLSLGLAIVLLTSCKDDEGLPLTPELVNRVKAYDLDNNGNSSDIRVDFKVRDNLNVTEYRAIVIPSNISNSFDVGNAITLPEERYLEIEPETFNNDYSITRLPSNFFDVNGEQIRVNLEYVVAVLVVGTGNQQLSEFSRPFTLQDRAIYSGDYEGMRLVDLTPCCAAPGNTCECNDCVEVQGLIAFFLANNEITSTIKEVGGKYKGFLICIFCGPQISGNELSFIIINNTLFDPSVQQTGKCYGSGVCRDCTPDVDPCDAIFTGQGTITNELNIEISLSGDDCVGFHEMTLFLTRQ